MGRAEGGNGRDRQIEKGALRDSDRVKEREREKRRHSKKQMREKGRGEGCGSVAIATFL